MWSPCQSPSLENIFMRLSALLMIIFCLGCLTGHSLPMLFSRKLMYQISHACVLYLFHLCECVFFSICKQWVNFLLVLLEICIAFQSLFKFSSDTWIYKARKNSLHFNCREYIFSSEKPMVHAPLNFTYYLKEIFIFSVTLHFLCRC